MPFLDQTKIGPERFMSYLQPYLTLVLPNLLFLTAIFFCFAALGRKMLRFMPEALVLLIGYLIVGTSSRTQPQRLFSPSSIRSETAARRIRNTGRRLRNRPDHSAFRGPVVQPAAVGGWAVSARAVCVHLFQVHRAQALGRGGKKAASKAKAEYHGPCAAKAAPFILSGILSSHFCP